MLFHIDKNTMLHLFRAGSIARRYMVTNGFDGALTMLGMLTGFYTSGMSDIPVALSACMGAAIALFISGLSSAYLSEKAEREKELHDLEQALIADLKDSDYGHASRYLPLIVALVNGLSPFVLSLFILSPLVTTHPYQHRAVPKRPFEWRPADCIPDLPWSAGNWRCGNRPRRTFLSGSTPTPSV